MVRCEFAMGRDRVRFGVENVHAVKPLTSVAQGRRKMTF